MIQYLGGAGWGLLIRRQLEAGSHTLWLMFIMFLPIATVGLTSLYGWSLGPDGAESDEVRKLVEHKSAWLNQPSFILRGVIYFAIRIRLPALLRRWMNRQDENRDMRAV